MTSISAPPATPSTLAAWPRRTWALLMTLCIVLFLDQFAEAARQATRGRVRGVYIAPDLDQVAPFIWSGGGHVVDDLEKPTTLAPAAAGSASALEKLLEVVRNPQITFSQAQLERRS